MTEPQKGRGEEGMKELTEKQKSELLKWQKEELTRIKASSNLELLEDTISSAGGDDYDGCFTKRGAWSFEQEKQELSKRLISVKFIDKELFTP